METPIGDMTNEQDDRATTRDDETPRRRRSRSSGRLLDLKAAEAYSGISAWTLRSVAGVPESQPRSVSS